MYPEHHNLISTSQPEEVTKPDESTEEPTSFPIVHSEETPSEHFNVNLKHLDFEIEYDSRLDKPRHSQP